jgi:hypothetical protein
MILSLLISLQFSLPSWLPDEFKLSASFEILRIAADDVVVKRKEDGSEVHLRVEQADRVLDYNRADGVIGVQTEDGPVPANGIPIGEKYVMSLGIRSTSTSVVAGSVSEIVYVSIQSEPRMVNGRVKLAARDQKGDVPILDRYARQILANVAARRLGPLQEARFSANKYHWAHSLWGGATMVNLTEWANAHNIVVDQAAESQTVSFKSGDESYLVPLGSKAIRIGSQWKQMKDVVMKRGSDWFVSSEFLP